MSDNTDLKELTELFSKMNNNLKAEHCAIIQLVLEMHIVIAIQIKIFKIIKLNFLGKK